MRFVANSWKLFPSKSRSAASPSRCPPLTTTFFAPSLRIRTAAFFIWSFFVIRIPVRTSASGMFGVTTAARGIRSLIRVPRASSRSRGLPPLATMTGSTTSLRILYRRIFFATQRMISDEESMPVFAASTPMSLATESNCASMNSTGMS
jgi:hypothetical protein